MKVVIDYKTMSIDEKGVKEVVRTFKKKGSEIVAIDVPSIVKKSSGVAYKEVSLSFADSQLVTLRVSEKNAVFQAVLNGRVVPIKNQENLEKAVIELIDMMDAGRKAFVKKLEARKMEVPQKATTSASVLRAELQAKRDGLKDSVENLERELSEFKQVEETAPVATMPEVNQTDSEMVEHETGVVTRKSTEKQGFDVELRPVVSKGDETLSIEQAIERAMSQTNGTIETGDSMVWALSKNSLNKMIAKTNKDGEKPYQAERIKAIQNLKELALTAKEPMIRDDESSDAEVESIYEYMTKFSDDDKVFNLRLLCKKYKKPSKRTKDKMHSMAAMDKVDSPINHIDTDGQLIDLEISFVQEKLEKGDGIGSVSEQPVSPSVGNRDASIANAPENENTQDDNRFADTGYIAGSRKEMAASFIRNAGKDKKQLGVTDIDWLAIEENPREAEAVIVKANVIGEPDYEALVEGGMKPATAFLISKVYASIAPKPVTDSPKARKAYVRGIETLRKNLEAMKEPEEVSNYLRNTVYEEMTEPQYTAEEIELREQLLRDYKNGKPDAKLKWLEIRKAALERTKQEGDLYAAWNSLGERFVGVVKHRFDTGSKAFNDAVKEAKYRGKPDSMDWAQKKQVKKTESDSEASKTKKPRFELFVSDSYERVGGRAVSVDSTKALKDHFGLRDIQSGNWVLKDKTSAEFHVTRSAEAFADMADILGIEDSKISIGGRLAMAFGARGKAGARAHYESVHRVINLTKMNGGGSLGHEWFHAFDNLLVEKMGLGVSGAGDFLTEYPELAGETPVAKAFSALVSAMKVGSVVVDRVVKYDMRDIEVLKYNLKVRNSFLVKLTNAKDFQEAFEMINDPAKAYKKGAKEQFERLAAAHFGGDYASSMTAKEKLNETEFYRNAQMLDGDKKKKYWSTNLEMAARAFSSYLEDKLEQQGRKNDYLSNHANNDVNAYGFINAKPFPEGEERERINAAFDALFSVVKQENVMDSIIEMIDNDEASDREQEVLGTDFDFDLLNASDIELDDEDFEV